MPYSRFIVTAKFHHREEDGESHQDGSTLHKTYFETISFSLSKDEKVSAIFEKLDGQHGDLVGVRIFEDLNSFERTGPS